MKNQWGPLISCLSVFSWNQDCCISSQNMFSHWAKVSLPLHLVFLIYSACWFWFKVEMPLEVQSTVSLAPFTSMARIELRCQLDSCPPLSVQPPDQLHGYSCLLPGKASILFPTEKVGDLVGRLCWVSFDFPFSMAAILVVAEFRIFFPQRAYSTTLHRALTTSIKIQAQWQHCY